MEQIPASRPSRNFYGFSSLGSLVHKHYTHRLLACSKISGYPVSNFTVGHLQNLLDFSSYKALLTSIMKIRDLANCAAEIILSVENMRPDHYSFDRTEVTSHVEHAILRQRFKNVTADDKDFIVKLIIEFSGNPSAWTLYAASGSRHKGIVMANLYKNVATGMSVADFPVYTASDTLTSLNDLPQYKAPGKVVLSEGNELELSLQKVEQSVADRLVILRLAAIRVVDHAFSLIMDKDVWAHFISPRFDGRSAAGNIERGKSLQTLAAYMQVLLNYTRHFEMEMFLKSQDMLQIWLGSAVPLSKRAAADLEMLRADDMLDAQNDVNQLFDKFVYSGQSSDYNLTHLVPIEFAAPMGLRSTLDTLTEEAAKLQLNVTFMSTADLTKPEYLPLMAGTALRHLDIVRSASYIVHILRNSEQEVEAAFRTLLLNTDQVASPEIKTRLRSLSLRPPLAWDGTVAVGWDLKKGLNPSLTHGKLRLDAASVPYSRRYVKLVKKEFYPKIFTSTAVVQAAAALLSKQGVDYDRAAEFRDDFGVEYKTMIPIQMADGPVRYRNADFSGNSVEWIRVLMGEITGKQLEIMAIDLATPRMLQKLATAVSSFGTLYQDKNAFEYDIPEVEDLKKADPATLTAIEGFGMPYGTTYTALYAMQPAASSDNLIPILPGLYIRFHTKIPCITTNMTRLKTMEGEKPVTIFTSNGVTMDVDEWIVEPTLWHHSLFPVYSEDATPSMLFTLTGVYIKDNVFINLTPVFSLAQATNGRMDLDLGTSEHSWSFDVRQHFIKYIKFGNYGTASPETEAEATESEMKRLMEQSEKAKQEAHDAKNAEDKAAGHPGASAEAAAKKDAKDSLPGDKPDSQEKDKMIL